MKTYPNTNWKYIVFIDATYGRKGFMALEDVKEYLSKLPATVIEKAYITSVIPFTFNRAKINILND